MQCIEALNKSLSLTPFLGKGSWVHVGLTNPVQIDKRLVAGTRVTVQSLPPDKADQKKTKGKAVAPSFPRTARGLYWGYVVRQCESLGAVFAKCPFKGAYDLTIGTSEKGVDVKGLTEASSDGKDDDDTSSKSDNISTKCPKHILIVFGGVRGLEFALENDQELEVEDVSLLFHHYVNTCAKQGSRTIRTEEAILVSLTALQPFIDKVTQS